MHANPDDLRRHYASLSDEALMAIDRGELVDVARDCYDYERALRGSPVAVRVQVDGEKPPDWIVDAACVCSYENHPGAQAAAPASAACEALTRAGIPAYLSIEENEPFWAQESSQFRVMVPGDLELEASSVLDRDIVNPEFAGTWKTHLETLTDEQFRAINFETVLAGLLDRVERLKRVYNEEVDRRSSLNKY
jgi:hypothetical protein